MKNKIGLVIACLLIGGMVMSALPASGKRGGGDRIKKLTQRVESLETAVKKNAQKVNRLDNCFGTRGLGEVQVGEYGVLRFDNKNPKAYAVTTTCSDD